MIKIITISDFDPPQSAYYPYYDPPAPTGEARVQLPFVVNNTNFNNWSGTVSAYKFIIGSEFSSSVHLPYMAEAIRGKNYLIFKKPFDTILDCDKLQDNTQIKFSITYRVA